MALNAYAFFNYERTQQLGGSEVDVYLIAQELSKDLTFQVSFVVGDFGQLGDEQYGKFTLYKSYPIGITGVPFWKRLWISLTAIPLLFSALRRSKADIYFQEGAGIETGLVRIFTWMHRKRMLHRTASMNDCNGGFRRQFPLRGIFAEFGLRHADKVITETKEQGDMLLKRWRLSTTTIYDTTPIIDTNNLFPPSKRTEIIWVGRLVQIKRPDLFLELARSLSKEHFTIIGLPEKAEQNLLEQTRKEVSLLPNVTFIEGLPYGAADAFYARSRLLINTSDYEGFPNVFLEAAVFSVPIFSLNVDPDRFIERHNVGVYARGNLQHLQKEITRLRHSPEILDAMGQSIRRYVAEHHDIKINIQPYKKEIKFLAT